MEKKWYQSKTIVSDLLTALFGLYLWLKNVNPGMPDLDPNLQVALVEFLAALGIFGRLNATKKVTL